MPLNSMRKRYPWRPSADRPVTYLTDPRPIPTSPAWEGAWRQETCWAAAVGAQPRRRWRVEPPPQRLNSRRHPRRRNYQRHLWSPATVQVGHVDSFTLHTTPPTLPYTRFRRNFVKGKIRLCRMGVQSRSFIKTDTTHVSGRIQAAS